MKCNIDLTKMKLDIDTFKMTIYKDGKEIKSLKSSRAYFPDMVNERIAILKNPQKNLEKVIEDLHSIFSNPKISINDGVITFDFFFIEPDGNYLISVSSKVIGSFNYVLE